MGSRLLWCVALVALALALVNLAPRRGPERHYFYTLGGPRDFGSLAPPQRRTAVPPGLAGGDLPVGPNFFGVGAEPEVSEDR